MAGAGYDVSASSAKAATSGVQAQANTYFVFGNSSLATGDSGQSATQTADAAATNRSPGTSNFSDLSAGAQASLQQGSEFQFTSLFPTIITAIIVAVIIKKIT